MLYKYRIYKNYDTFSFYRVFIADKPAGIYLDFMYEYIDKKPTLRFLIEDVAFEIDARREFCFSMEEFLERLGFSRKATHRITGIPYLWTLTRNSDIDTYDEFLALTKDLVEELNTWDFK